MERDGEAKQSDRLHLLKAFGEVGPAPAREVLLEVIRQERDSAIRKAGLLALQGYAEPGIGAAVLDLYASLTPDEQTAAQALLASRVMWSGQWLERIEAGTLPVEGISGEAVATMGRHGDERVSELIGKHFGASPAAVRPAGERVAELREILDRSPGNPYRGRPVFTQRCASCHVLFYSGGRIGPDLTSYQRDDLETMLTSIVDPNAEIREGYEGFTVKTVDGRLLTGFLTDRGAHTVSLRGFDGSDISLPLAQVADTTPLGRSLMPEGLLEGLSDQDLRDLFAYLRSAQPFLPE